MMPSSKINSTTTLILEPNSFRTYQIMDKIVGTIFRALNKMEIML